MPNHWLAPALAQPPIRHDWFASLIYSKLAECFGNSQEGQFGPIHCWYIALGEAEDSTDPAFTGIFLTEKGGLGFLSQGFMLRFCNGVVFIGPQDAALEGVEVTLVAVGLDDQQRVFFIVTDDYRSRFGVPDQIVAEALFQLREHGATMLSVSELLTSAEAVRVIWTVPAKQSDPDNPEAVENTAPLAQT